MAINMAKIDEMLKLATPEQKAAFNQSSVGQQYASQQNPVSQQNVTNSTIGKTAEQLQGELIAAQKASQLGSLEAAYKNSMGAFNQQMKLIPQEYKNQRIGVDTNMQKQNRSFGEFMASRGLKSSGAAAQGTIANSVAAQGATSQLRSEEMNAMNALRNQMLAAQTNYNADVAGVESGAAADLAKYQIEDLKAKESENKQMALDTLGRYSQDYTQGIIDIKGDGDPSNDWMIPYLESARSEKVAGIESSKAQAEAAQYEAAMDRWKLTGVADATVAALIGVPVGTPTSDYKFKAAQLELDKYKAYKTSGSGSGGSGGGSGEMTYKEFESQVLTTAESDPYLALKYVMDNAAFIKEEKGYDYYQKLYDRIRNINSAYGAKNTSINIGSAPDIKNPGLGILNVYNKLY